MAMARLVRRGHIVKQEDKESNWGLTIPSEGTPQWHLVPPNKPHLLKILSPFTLPNRRPNLQYMKIWEQTVASTL
jgi:hypothetical protein